jgi:hypothetical protein
MGTVLSRFHKKDILRVTSQAKCFATYRRKTRSSPEDLLPIQSYHCLHHIDIIKPGCDDSEVQSPLISSNLRDLLLISLLDRTSMNLRSVLRFVYIMREFNTATNWSVLKARFRTLVAVIILRLALDASHRSLGENAAEVRPNSPRGVRCKTYVTVL